MPERSSKRKAAADFIASIEQSGPAAKKAKAAPRRKAPQVDAGPWPEYFKGLEKLFKSLNTVIAFCHARKHLAVTFDTIRSSVEGLIKQPLDLARVAEIKAIIPDLVRFAYVEAESIRVHHDREVASSSYSRKSGRKGSPDFQLAPAEDPSRCEHVLVLDFVETNKNTQKIKEAAGKFSAPPALTQQQLMKLIEKRSQSFTRAVNELLAACAANGDDPVRLVQDAARAHVPVHPLKRTRPNDVQEEESANSGSNQPPKVVPDPQLRLPIDTIIKRLTEDEHYKGQIVKRREFQAKDAVWGRLNRTLSPAIKEALLSARKVEGFYSHQAAALNAIWDGKNVVVSTSTASGKSVIYQVPALCNLEEDKSSTAIFIYPTKALAQDQLTGLQQLLVRVHGLEGIMIAAYDGDTPKDRRQNIRENASIIFTNFDTLHASILPNEDTWRHFLRNLKMVVVDELHYYSGLMGTQVSFVARRLRRLCAAVGNRRCVFVSCSATINDPRGHMMNIFGVDDVEVITDDGAPTGHKDFLLWNPPFLDEMDPALGRSSSMQEACYLFRYLMKHGVRTILFCKIRRTCELVMKSIRHQLTAEGRQDILDRVSAYRGGYSVADRRRIEKDAFSGHLLGIIATNALELGVDIGTLDAVIMLGFPFGIASLRQQAGRAGRRARDSLAILVGDSLPIDQHYMLNPDEVFEKPTEPLIVDITNEGVLESHLQCAADELPIRLQDDGKYFGPCFEEVCKSRLICDKEGWYTTHPSYKPRPTMMVSLRGIQEDKYTVIDITTQDEQHGAARVLEEIELSRAIFETYEGGIFMHQGLTFLVREVDHDTRIAKIARADVNYYTKPRDFTDVDPSQTYRIREIKDSQQRSYFGRIVRKTVVFGFFKMRETTILDTVDLDSPPFIRSSTGFWIDVPRPTLNLLIDKDINPAEAIHAACHAVLSILPVFVLTALGDVGTECKAPQKEYMQKESQRKRPARLIFYDGTAASGICAKVYDRTHHVLAKALEILEHCGCEDGCPACIRSISCTEHNIVQNKIGAQIVLRGVLNLPIDADSIVPQYNRYHITVVEAEPVGARGIPLEPDED
ncbi:P-loop containing nucleoside triphosphate hydrolase protein [Dacryopinax primogenitus]|uniref:p-loop containing nucleoside triphosphate hydrolase protein n=1 Tax=Dacryopinax primogenitus (strain DJM 731) TaxID=1858805 RepID=M5GF41_DACPD|nr:P-loop containing nucleoside triphosphate hydrolase protein [Dacryopinax primogenitus]EJU03818.1 P-loop containing nucleoside triphosphate hydrolase protein [Dacryopinax primogenitus]